MLDYGKNNFSILGKNVRFVLDSVDELQDVSASCGDIAYVVGSAEFYIIGESAEWSKINNPWDIVNTGGSSGGGYTEADLQRAFEQGASQELSTLVQEFETDNVRRTNGLQLLKTGDVGVDIDCYYIKVSGGGSDSELVGMPALSYTSKRITSSTSSTTINDILVSAPVILMPNSTNYGIVVDTATPNISRYECLAHTVSAASKKFGVLLEPGTNYPDDAPIVVSYHIVYNT